MTGLREHYPLCCVLNFCLDRLLGVPSGIARGVAVSTILGEYVPRHFHKRVKYSLLRSEWLRIADNPTPCVEHLAPSDTVRIVVNDSVVWQGRVPQGHDALLYYTIWVV